MAGKKPQNVKRKSRNVEKSKRQKTPFRISHSAFRNGPQPGCAPDSLAFYQLRGEWDDLRFPPPGDDMPVLKLLGPLPFPRGGFPVMGFLATLYDHVAEYARLSLGETSSQDADEPRGRKRIGESHSWD